MSSHIQFPIQPGKPRKLHTRNGHARNVSLMSEVRRFPEKNSLEAAYYFISDAPIKAVCNPSAYAPAGT